jgi:hypothetical protein
MRPADSRDTAVEGAPARALVAQEQVGGDVEIGRQHQLLMDQGDALPLCVGDAAELHGLAVNQQLAFVGDVGAAQNFHQRAFAGPVLAHERQHLAAAHVQVHVAQGNHAWKALGDGSHFQVHGIGTPVVATCRPSTMFAGCNGRWSGVSPPPSSPQASWRNLPRWRR